MAAATAFCLAVQPLARCYYFEARHQGFFQRVAWVSRFAVIGVSNGPSPGEFGESSSVAFVPINAKCLRGLIAERSVRQSDLYSRKNEYGSPKSGD